MSAPKPKPAWVNTQMAMARYCEPYFNALNYWKDYKDVNIIKNRLLVVNTLVQATTEFANKEEIYQFNIMQDNSTDSLPEYFPDTGIAFKSGNDKLAFEAAQKLIPESLFQIGGCFFQKGLLRALAGFDEATLIQANKETRDSIIESTKKLLRVPENAGNVYVIYYTGSQTESNMLDLAAMNVESTKMYQAILTYRDSLRIQTTATSSPSEPEMLFTPSKRGRSHVDDDDEETCSHHKSKSATKAKSTSTSTKSRKSADSAQSSTTSASKKAKSSTSKSKSSAKSKSSKAKSKAREEEEEDEAWTEAHESIGTKIAKKFGEDLYFGEVVRYLPPSKEGATDALYHIVYDDGDEEDLSDAELSKGKALYTKQPIEWTSNHISIGTSVGRIQNITLWEGGEPMEEEGEASASASNNKKRKTVAKLVEFGTVTQYAIGRVGNDQMYEVTWAQGHTQQLTDKKYQAAEEMYRLERESKNILTAASTTSSDFPSP